MQPAQGGNFAYSVWTIWIWNGARCCCCCYSNPRVAMVGQGYDDFHADFLLSETSIDSNASVYGGYRPRASPLRLACLQHVVRYLSRFMMIYQQSPPPIKSTGMFVFYFLIKSCPDGEVHAVWNSSSLDFKPFHLSSNGKDACSSAVNNILLLIYILILMWNFFHSARTGSGPAPLSSGCAWIHASKTKSERTN